MENLDRLSIQTDRSTQITGRASVFSFIGEMSGIEEETFEINTPIQMILSKFCDNNLNEYIFHTRIYLEYDEEEAFVFVFKSSLVFTHLFDEKEHELKVNPIIYIIKYQQIYFFELHV